MNSVMKINDYEVWVNLGCDKDEQAYLQPVLFQVRIEFEKDILAEKTDLLTDAVDYVAITNLLQESAKSKTYHLIEHLCFEASEKLFDYIQSKKIKGELLVELTKIRVPVPYLKSGVSWTCRKKL